MRLAVLSGSVAIAASAGLASPQYGNVEVVKKCLEVVDYIQSVATQVVYSDGTKEQVTRQFMALEENSRSSERVFRLTMGRRAADVMPDARELSGLLLRAVDCAQNGDCDKRALVDEYFALGNALEVACGQDFKEAN